MDRNESNKPLTLAENFNKYFTVHFARTAKEKFDGYHIRYRVYCEEFGYEDATAFPDEAVILFTCSVAALIDYPIDNTWLAAGLGLYLLLLWRFPWLWLIVIPLLLPVLDLTPITGRTFFSEFDFFILVTGAAGLMRKDGWVKPLGLGLPGWLLLCLVITWQTYITARGLLPLQPIDANSFTSYYSHYNSLRLVKGFFWALLLLPLVGQAIGRGNPVSKLFIIGVLSGLTANLTAILWERALFVGIFDFSTAYRVTGFFSGMTTGGAPLDAHLIFSLPFILALFILWKHWFTHFLGFLLLIFTTYGLSVTFSRADYGAMAASLITAFLAWLVIHRQDSASHTGKTRYLIGITVVALLLSTPFFSGEFIKHRFSTVSEDLQSKFEHWNSALDMIGDDPKNSFLGLGRGTFPRTNFWSHAVNDPLSTISHRKEGDNTFIRMSGSQKRGDLFLTQRFTITEPGQYRLSMSLKPQQDKAERLLVEICERLIYQAYKTCRWIGTNTESKSDEWVTFNKKFNTNGLGKQYWYGSRPVQISILNRGIKNGLDINQVQIITPSGKRLLSNSSFDNGLDSWFHYSGDHMGWHIKNIWVDTLFEGGWVGLAIFILFVAAVLAISIKRLRNRDIFSVLFLATLAGLFVIGLFDSILDEPRLTLLLFLSTWVVTAKGRPDISINPKGQTDLGQFIQKAWQLPAKY